MQKAWLITKKNGFSLVEVILSSAVFVLLVTALVGAYLYGQEATALAGNRARANMLAEEGLEAVRNIRDENFSNLIDGTYGLSTSGNQWNLSGLQDTSDIFTRSVSISSADANRKNIVSTVTWQQNPQRTGTVSLASHLTFWQKVVPSCPNMASCLSVDTSLVGMVGNTQVTGITLINTNTVASSTIDKITVSWTGGAGNNRIIIINIDGSSVWIGSRPSGTLLDITNFDLLANTTYPLTYLEFSKNIKKATLSITFTMSDASTKTVSGIVLP